MTSRKKVLIIDDETDLCLLLKDYFNRKNYEVTISHTLNDGKNQLESLKPEILFLDNNLPDDEGWQYAPELATEYPDTYMVLVSAYHPDEPKMPDASRYRIIEKPISFSDLDKQFSAL